ncbi:hypothetical protein V6N13_053498 [Hibiscus sabdariffa]
MPTCFSTAWSVSVWLGDGGCWLRCHAFRMADGLSSGGDMVSYLPYVCLLFCDTPLGGAARCWPSLARTLPLGSPAREQIRSFICARVRLVFPLRSAWCTRVARAAAHPAAWLLIVAHVLTGLDRYCPRLFPCPASVLLPSCKFSACASVCLPAHYGVVACSR